MKKLKKLSLENEMKKEAEQIEKKVRKDKSLDDITVSDEMEKELFNKIQDYEYDKRHKKVVRKKKKSKLVIGALAAVLILVCGSVMTSVGSKSYWKTLWNKEAGDETLSYVDVENMETMESEEMIGSDFHSGMTCLLIVEHKVFIAEVLSFGGFYEDEFYTVVSRGVEVHHPVVGRHVDPFHGEAFGVNIGGRGDIFPIGPPYRPDKEQRNEQKPARHHHILPRTLQQFVEFQ